MTYSPNPALKRAIQTAIANGAPVYVNRNSFQHWAITTLAGHGIAAREKGNWIECDTPNGDSHTIYTRNGVEMLIEDLGA